MQPRSDDSFTTVKHYQGNALPGAQPTSPAASNANRNFLYVENVGVNEGLFWFDVATNAGQALRIAAGDFRQFAAKCPIERFYIQSVLGTTFAIIEGMDNRRPR